MPRKTTKRLRSLAKAQRSAMSAAEVVLWKALRAGRLKNWKFRRQAPLEGFIVDFVCFEARLIIEADGPLHETDEAKRYDARRDAVLRAAGYRMLRLPNNLILGAPDLAVKRIEAMLETAEQADNV